MQCTIKALIYAPLMLSVMLALAAAAAAAVIDQPTTTASTQRHHRQHRQHHQKHQRPLQRRQELASHPASQVELLDLAAAGAAPTTGSQAPHNATARLRRLSARDYYNKVVQRRLNAQRHDGTPDWAYNSYNVQSNTFGPPMSHRSGKGDDNTRDVEFIESASRNPEWTAPRRGYGGGNSNPTTSPHARRAIVTSAPPPLVPARRGYATAGTPTTTTSSGNDMPHVTEDPFETNNIGRSQPSDTKDMEGRHICVQQRTITMPVKTTEVYTRPIWKHVSTPCQPPTHANQMCTRVQLVHEQAYRDVIRHKSAQQVTYDCCTGWMRESSNADGCMKPICSMRCQNGGSCTGPETCSCPSGYTGRFCEQDVNECREQKPCDQACVNTAGSYYCKCREGFVLQADQQSCKKIDLHEDDAFEARDLENEIETDEDVTARLQKIERSLANERVHTNELQKSLQATYSVVDTLTSRLSTLEKQQQDINRLQSNLYATETRTNKLEGMVNLLMKCRNGPNAYCP